MIPVILALTLSILLALVFAIPGIFISIRWFVMLGMRDSRAGDIKIPTFYATESEEGEELIEFKDLLYSSPMATPRDSTQGQVSSLPFGGTDVSQPPAPYP